MQKVPFFKFMERKHILIVDDEQEICFLLAALLQKMGYVAEFAYSLGEGIAKLSDEEPFDIVFLDLNLPDGLGYKIIPDIKASNQDTKVVMISAHDGMLRRIKNEGNDIDQYISKPFNRDHISTVLSELEA